MKSRLGRQETQALAYLQMRRQRTVKVGDLVRALRVTPLQERELFRRLSKGRLIARVRPGLYLVPAQLPLGGTWSPDEALALTTLIKDRGGRGQICGPNAFSRYGFSTQIPNRTYAYNDRISGTRNVGSVALTLIKVATARLGDTETVRDDDGVEVMYSSRARTLVDAVYDWSRFNSLPRAYEWIATDLKKKRTKAADLVRITIKYGDVGTIRRIGALLDREGTAEPLLKKLERALPSSSSLIPWIPRRPKRGRIDRRWGIIWNDRD